jgi:hypothetical protein
MDTVTRPASIAPENPGFMLDRREIMASGRRAQSEHIFNHEHARLKVIHVPDEFRGISDVGDPPLSAR